MNIGIWGDGEQDMGEVGIAVLAVLVEVPDGDGCVTERADEQHVQHGAAVVLAIGERGADQEHERAEPCEPMRSYLVASGFELVVGRVPLQIQQAAGDEQHEPDPQ